MIASVKYDEWYHKRDGWYVDTKHVNFDCIAEAMQFVTHLRNNDKYENTEIIYVV